MMKANPPLTPLLEFGIDILGNKNHLPGLTDELVFFRVRLGSDKRQDRRAIRRGNRHPATSAFKTMISDQAESKLPQIESQASILVPNEDGDML
jgi:hypothetical protein